MYAINQGEEDKCMPALTKGNEVISKTYSTLYLDVFLWKNKGYFLSFLGAPQ